MPPVRTRAAASLALALLAACASADGAPPPDGTAAFDWFAYRGDDPVHRRAAAGPDEYRNPIVSGFHPDPSIVRAGEDYYLVHSSFAYFPGVPIFHSRDLVSWTQIGHVLDRPSQLDLDSAGISRGIFAPAIEHHDGTFYLVTTLVDNGGNFFVTAADPAGPWSDPVWLDVDGIDPSFFFDDDGRAYLLNNGPPEGAPRYDGHRAIWIQEFDPAAKRLIGPRAVLVDGGADPSANPIWIEGPHIVRKDGWYYLICAEGGTAEQHSEVVFRSRAPTGPYEPAPVNPILTQRHLDPSRPFPVTTAGHADFVDTPSGEWWAVFLGVRPWRGDHYNTGRETFLLPVRWEDGWPRMLDGDAVVPAVHRRPAFPRQPAPAVPTSGNFTLRDEFDADSLAHYWTFIRTPRETWHTRAGGGLALRPRPAPLGERVQPSFVGRRQQHAHFEATTQVRFAAANPGDRAGLVAFHDDAYHAFVGIENDGGTRRVVVERRAGGPPETLGAAALPGDGPVRLRISSDGATYAFAYAAGDGAWTTLAEGVDATFLSTKTVGGFVGTMLGMYAASAP